MLLQFYAASTQLLKAGTDMMHSQNENIAKAGHHELGITPHVAKEHDSSNTYE